MTHLCPSEVYSHLFVLLTFIEIVVLAPGLQLCHLLYVGCVIIVGDEPRTVVSCVNLI